MNRCKLCCIPDTRPDTAFVDGVCSACISFAKRPTIDWSARKAELLGLLDRHDGRCIVPSSGGKDSTYQVLTLLELGADVTVVTASTCHLTPIGRANIDNLARYARTIEVSPNKTVRAKLNRLGLTMVGDISWPEHVAIFSTPFKAAVDLGIPLMFYGENPQGQYGGPLGTEEARQMTRRWTMEFGGFLGLRPADMVGLDGITARDMQDYALPTDQDMQALGVEAHFLGQYIEWDSHRNAEVAVAHGMQVQLPCWANWWVAENLDNWSTSLHDHACYRKFGFGRLAAQISVDIRQGKISRTEALGSVQDRDGLFPEHYMGISMDEGLGRLGMSRAEVMAALDNFTNWDLFYGVEDGRPILREFA
jgi:N-acetyl sugar amidotransferase